MSKYYRVKRDSFLWDKGAILEYRKESDDYNEGYHCIDDIWDATEHNEGEYIATRDIIEKNPTWFERVYQVNVLKKTMYLLKGEAKKVISDTHKTK